MQNDSRRPWASSAGLRAMCAVPVWLLITVCVPSTAEAQDPLRWHGTYSAEQAQRGEALYAQNCIVCHGQDLMGGDRAPAAAGPALVARWSERSLRELLDYVQTQMPMNSPGGLTRHQNADILAFMLGRSGATPGSEDLWLDGAETRRPTPPRSADYGKVAIPSNQRADAFYTEVQAERGRLAFNRQCAYCHTVDPTLSTPEDLVEPLPRTFGGHFVERVMNDRVVYPHALALFSKLQSMPAHNTRSITDQQRVNIVAYILQANGLPAGDEEISVSTDAMRLMMLNEPGFERIFNGKNFTGWNFVIGANCLNTPESCATNTPLDVLRVENHTIVCECYMHGYFYTDKKYKNFTLRFDTRFERPAYFEPEDDDELFSGGSGYLIHADVDSPGYPKSIEVEGRHRDLLEYVGIHGPGEMGEIDLEAKRRAIRPLGQWNAIEISSKDGQVQSRLNGVLVSSSAATDFYDYAGHIVFQIQGAKMYWRNIRIRAEP